MSEYYKEHSKTVRGYLYRLCQNSELADELTQETFYQAMKTVKNYRGDCKPSVWLCQIARHVWYKYLDKQKKFDAVQLDENIQYDGTSALDSIIKSELALGVYSKMQKLPGEMREVLYLRILGELSYKEIAKIMGKTENWARVMYYRGKQQLLKGADE